MVECIRPLELIPTGAREILRVNPLARSFPETAAVLREERDAARADSRLAGAFKSFRLNVPSGDESTMLLTVDDWERVTTRPVPEREGRPIVGIDLGAGRAWSAAVALWRNGRVEALAVVPRVARWSEASEDIRATRKLALDGPLAIAPESRALLTASLAAAMVANDDAGNVRMVKRGTNNQARDDVAAALVLAAGALARAPKPRRRYHGLAG